MALEYLSGVNVKDKVEIERAALALLERALEEAESETERIAWLRGQTDVDPAVRDRAITLLGAVDAIGERLATGSAGRMLDDDAPTVPPERVGAYRIVELIGEGGMGAVFRAERDMGDFEHVVAIKLIRRGAMSEALVARFERERQILASLAHPNIARLYDGGDAGEGGPFIVMEYIEGVPITRWAEEKGLDLDDRLALFDAVCDAIGFAHQNLIIHRDLTPSNVLVTADGAPKIIDFGIARPQEEQPHEPPPDGALDSLSLTPGYAAPERYSSSAATTLSDIFSLGRILERLTGQFGKAEVEAVVSAANATNPAERYQTVATLREDLARLRRGEPVAVYSNAPGYRLRKFVRRRIYAVVAIAAIFVLLVGGLAATAIGFQRARASQAKAEQRFGEVRALANTLLFDVYDAVDAVPGSTAARDLLASTAQGYLDVLARDPDAPRDVRMEAGLGLMRLADVEGGVGGGTRGARDQAMTNYARADRLLTRLYREDPDDERVALALSELRTTRADTMVHIAEDMDRGVAFARSVGPILDRRCTDRDACALARAKAHVAEGQNQYWLEDFDAAIASYDTAIAGIGRMSEAGQGAAEAVRSRALALRLKGDSLYYSDEKEPAVQAYRQAVAILAGQRQSLAGDVDLTRDLAIAEWSLGGGLDDIGRTGEGVAALDRGYRIMRELVEADPEDIGGLRLLAVIGGQRALTLSSAGRYADAIEGANASLAIRRQLSRSQPEESGYFRDVAIQLAALGDIFARAGRRAKACTAYEDAIGQFDALDRRWGMSDFDRDDTYARISEEADRC